MAARARRIRFDKLIDFWDPMLRRAFMRAVQNVRQTSQVEQIARSLERGDVESAIRAVGLDPVNFRPVDETLTRAYEAGGNATAAGVPKLGRPGELRVFFQFNVRNPRAEEWITRFSSNLVTEIVDDQRDMIRKFLQQGLAAGKNPRSTVLDLVGRVGASGQREGGMIGLTSSQADWVRSYEEALRSDSPGAALTKNLRDRRFDGAVQRAIDTSEHIPDETVDKMVASYKNRALRFRAEGIARTETMAAMHESQQQAMEQLVSTGEVTRDQVTFVWRTAEDDRVRESHEVMDGQEVAMGEMFTTGDGNQLEYPGDPNGPAGEIINCRCWREPSVDFLAGVD